MKAPQSGWPTAFQPSGLVTTPRISRQLSARRGQPSASAIGLGMAITIGVVATLGYSRGISTACLVACCRSATC